MTIDASSSSTGETLALIIESYWTEKTDTPTLQSDAISVEIRTLSRATPTPLEIVVTKDQEVTVTLDALLPDSPLPITFSYESQLRQVGSSTLSHVELTNIAGGTTSIKVTGDTLGITELKLEAYNLHSSTQYTILEETISIVVTSYTRN